ncbi:MAG: hypothetical protein JWO09_1112 [Bacteroidetes bacterium]|nr:hypothetical protein [Bacteroidota bacterium]
MKKPKSIPFSFVLDNLHLLDPVIKPMFGCHSVYIGNKVVLTLRDKDDADSGVWIATTPEFHSSLKKEFPNMRSITVFGTGTSSWQVLPKDADDFEASVNHLCGLVIKGDPRIGKVPKPKKKKSL